MPKKVLLVLSVLVLAMGVTSVAADGGGDGDGDDERPAIVQVYSEDDDIWVPAFNDGRLNATDMLAPFAVYYERTPMQITNDDGARVWAEVITAIQVWVVDGNGVGQLAINVPLSAIEAAMNATNDVELGAANGVSLGYSPASDAFWASAPGYSFTWAAW